MLSNKKLSTWLMWSLAVGSVFDSTLALAGDRKFIPGAGAPTTINLNDPSKSKNVPGANSQAPTLPSAMATARPGRGIPGAR